MSPIEDDMHNAAFGVLFASGFGLAWSTDRIRDEILTSESVITNIGLRGHCNDTTFGRSQFMQYYSSLTNYHWLFWALHTHE